MLFTLLKLGCKSAVICQLYKMFHMYTNYRVFSPFELCPNLWPASSYWPVSTGSCFVFLGMCQALPPFIFLLHFTVSLRVRGDTVVLACSLEHKILSLQTVGLRYSTWCLTAPHTVSAYDDSAFVPVAGSGYFTMHTDWLCAESPSGKLSNVEFCKVRLAPGLCICRWWLYTYIWRRRIPVCSFSPHPWRLWLSNCRGGASPSSYCSSTFLQKTTLLVSQWVRGIHSTACHAAAPNYLPFTYPTFLSWSFALPAPFPETYLSYTKPVSGRAFSIPLRPSSTSLVSLLPLPHSQNPPVFLHCVSSFCSNERQGSARQTPGVWQSYLLCLHISSSGAPSLSFPSPSLRLPFSLPEHQSCRLLAVWF